jgi:hypothetical protein
LQKAQELQANVPKHACTCFLPVIQTMLYLSKSEVASYDLMEDWLLEHGSGYLKILLLMHDKDMVLDEGGLDRGYILKGVRRSFREVRHHPPIFCHSWIPNVLCAAPRAYYGVLIRQHNSTIICIYYLNKDAQDHP